jgi:hypothetical protein
MSFEYLIKMRASPRILKRIQYIILVMVICKEVMNADIIHGSLVRGNQTISQSKVT